MKRINMFKLFAVFSLAVAASCNKSFLDVDPKAIQLESEFYKTSDQLLSGLIAAYDPVSWEGTAPSSYASFIFFVAAGDECYSGGSTATDIPQLQAMNNYTLDAATGPQLNFWQQYYTGVARCNVFINNASKTIDGVPDAVRNRYLAEAKILRAYYYFTLVKMFGRIPLYTVPLEKSTIYTVSQVPPETVYAQVEKDLKEAIAETSLPDKVPAATEGGRFTRGTAKALLGKVYLYEKKWSDAAQALSEVNGTPEAANIYGYKLLENYSDIFRPDNEFNAEAILEICHTAKAGSRAGGPISSIEGMMTSLYVGPRTYNGPVYTFGWGVCPIIPAFYEFMRADPRYRATIANIDSLVALKQASYVPGYLNTGKFIQKFAPLKQFRPTGIPAAQLNYPQNYIEIRLADTYLMEAEALLQSGGDAVRAATLLNAVRVRVGLPAAAATLENVYNERRLELATEGHRWFDLVRTGQAPSVLASKGFKANKNEVLPIPLFELTNTKLVQNAGY
ncbi:RagB/SusD family nutrient uptake outer membrane protein [Niabella aurantiaca]|uniref:RagB/SusD family nutrient uptake outer membrane protein n=1 Tax=Niabella aurantiaca TaxID=379900 RepID=UPI00038220C1|nr:RagB/SusD family nutrient uptake outer membrane protein [Niabella aurantiaca]